MTTLLVSAACRLPGSRRLLLRCCCCRAAAGLPAVDGSRTRSAAHGRTGRQLQQCNSCSSAATIVAAAAAGANWCTPCLHARYHARVIDQGCSETGWRDSRVGEPAGDQRRRTREEYATTTIINHDTRRTTAATRCEEPVVPGRVAATRQESAGERGDRVPRSLRPTHEKGPMHIGAAAAGPGPSKVDYAAGADAGLRRAVHAWAAAATAGEGLGYHRK